MVKKADEMKAEDDKVAARIEAKNKLENYAYSIKTSVDDKKVAGRLSPEDKKSVDEAVESTLNWIQENESAETEEFQAQQGAGGEDPAGHDEASRRSSRPAAK